MELRFLGILLLLGLVAAGVAGYVVYVPYGPPGETFVEIPSGSGTRAIAARLRRAGVIRSEEAFYGMRVVNELTKGGTLKAGEYRFDHPAAMGEVYGRVARGDVYTLTLSVPEGFNIFDIAEAVEAAGLGSRAEFLTAEREHTELISPWTSEAGGSGEAASQAPAGGGGAEAGGRDEQQIPFGDDNQKGKGNSKGNSNSKGSGGSKGSSGSSVGMAGTGGGGAPTSLEGYLFPDTYHFSRHATPLQMLTAMVRRFGRESEQLGLHGPEVVRTVILASLVEKEVSQAGERPLVAGVFVNRLAKGIPLATDPAVAYAALLEGRWRGTIYASDLQARSAYNTYRHAGLPPGPICNPGVAALRAAMHPAQTDYLYFVSDAAGHSRFSSTLKEHEAKVEAYRRAQGR